jgi:hypothetical protein
MISNMKHWLISFLMIACLGANAKDKAIQSFILDEQTVYVIPVATDRVTTISFPGAISAMDAAQASADPQKPAPFLISHSTGASYFSVRAEMRKALTNINVRWNNKSYVLELMETNEPLLSVTFVPAPDTSSTLNSEPATPSRLLALLDEAKAYPLLKAYHADVVAQVAYRNYDKEPRIVDCTNYAVQINEAFRFDSEDTLIFRVAVINKTDRELIYAPNGFFLRVGERTFPQSISDASGIVPPHAAAPAYFAVTGTPNGGRNDISIKNDFFVLLNAHAVEPAVEPAPAPVSSANSNPETRGEDSSQP